MSQQDVKMVTVRMPLPLYEKVKTDAESEGASISDVVRDAVVTRYEKPIPHAAQTYEDYIQPVKQLCDTISNQLQVKDQQLNVQLQAKDEQLKTKDQQIDQLHQLLAMKEKAFEKANLQLEDLRQGRGVWRRIKGVFVSEVG